MTKAALHSSKIRDWAALRGHTLHQSAPSNQPRVAVSLVWAKLTGLLAAENVSEVGIHYEKDKARMRRAFTESQTSLCKPPAVAAI